MTRTSFEQCEHVYDQLAKLMQRYEEIHIFVRRMIYDLTDVPYVFDKINTKAEYDPCAKKLLWYAHIYYKVSYTKMVECMQKEILTRI